VPSRPTLPSRTAPRRRPAPRRRAPHRARPGPRLVPSVITNSNSRPPAPPRRRPVPNPRRSSAQVQVARRHRRSVSVPPARFDARPAPGRRRPPASALPQHSREGRGRRPLRTKPRRLVGLQNRAPASARKRTSVDREELGDALSDPQPHRWPLRLACGPLGRRAPAAGPRADRGASGLQTVPFSPFMAVRGSTKPQSVSSTVGMLSALSNHRARRARAGARRASERPPRSAPARPAVRTRLQFERLLDERSPSPPSLRL
jgi:hypothetical protein